MFLRANITEYGTFKSFYTRGGDTLLDKQIFINLIFLDTVYDHTRRPELKILTDSILKFTLAYRPEGDIRLIAGEIALLCLRIGGTECVIALSM